MNRISCICLVLMSLTISPFAVAQKAQKSKSASAKSTAPKTLYVEPEQRNYAQNLGGYMFFDYTFREDRALITKCLCTKAEKKELVDKYTYATFEEAYKNLPVLPAAAEVDTREKMAHYVDYEVTPRVEAIDLYEPEPELDAETKRLQKLRMDNAKKAAKGQPFDTIPFDPKWPQYNKVLDKMKAASMQEYKLFDDIVGCFDVSDPDYFRWLNELSGGVPRFYYNTYAPLMKQIIKEWFASDACKQVQAIEDELRARAEQEKPKKTPDWFVEGRKREGEIIADYNRKLVERWLKKTPTVTQTCKSVLVKLMEYNKEVEAIRGDDPVTEAYISVHYSLKGSIKRVFHNYYYLMDLSGIPLIRTPDTQEGKKFKLEESPWKLAYPYEPRK